jgi:hypothetical protein
MVIAAAIRLAENVGEQPANVIPGQPLEYGLAAFGALLVLLFIVTRFNSDR